MVREVDGAEGPRTPHYLHRYAVCCDWKADTPTHSDPFGNQIFPKWGGDGFLCCCMCCRWIHPFFWFACRWAERKPIVYTDLMAVLTAVVRDFGSEVEVWRPWSALRLSCVLFKFQTLRFATSPCPNQSKSLQIGCWTSVGRQEACGFGRSGFERARPECHGNAACPFMRYVHYFGRLFNDFELDFFGLQLPGS